MIYMCIVYNCVMFESSRVYFVAGCLCAMMHQAMQHNVTNCASKGSVGIVCNTLKGCKNMPCVRI